nr:PREDICTED: lysine-specific demethylase JMJ25-like [Daucus carota subsp. sativus]
MEAHIRGLPLSDVKVNWCGTSIADYHPSCTKCRYDLCISCCRDLRAGSLQAGHMGSMNQYKNPGVGYLHGETCKPRSNRTVGTSSATKDGGPRKAKLPEWRPNKDDSISCPPESLGGCGGKGILRLNQVLQDSWLSNVILKAEDLCQQYNLDGLSEDPTHGCSCYNLAGDDTATEKIRKAIDIQAGDQKHFQVHWSKGEPAIVTGVLDRTYGLSWEPMVMSRAMHDKSHTGVTPLNCLNGCKKAGILHPPVAPRTQFLGIPEYFGINS